MTELRQPTATPSPRTASPSLRLVVRGAQRPQEIWPAVRTDVGPSLASSRTAEVGEVDAVVALLAAVESTDPADFRARHPLSIVALRALAAHCQAAILQAAARVDGDLTPEAVLREVHVALGAPLDEPVVRLAS